MPRYQTTQTVIRGTALADAERTQASTDIMYGVTPMHATNEASCAPGSRATHPARYRQLRPLTHLLSAHRRTPPSHYPNVKRVTRLRLPIRAEHPRSRMTSGRLPVQEEMDSKREIQCPKNVNENPSVFCERIQEHLTAKCHSASGTHSGYPPLDARPDVTQNTDGGDPALSQPSPAFTCPCVATYRCQKEHGLALQDIYLPTDFSRTIELNTRAKRGVCGVFDFHWRITIPPFPAFDNDSPDMRREETSWAEWQMVEPSSVQTAPLLSYERGSGECRRTTPSVQRNAAQCLHSDPAPRTPSSPAEWAQRVLAQLQSRYAQYQDLCTVLENRQHISAAHEYYGRALANAGMMPRSSAAYGMFSSLPQDNERGQGKSQLRVDSRAWPMRCGPMPCRGGQKNVAGGASLSPAFIHAPLILPQLPTSASRVDGLTHPRNYAGPAPFNAQASTDIISPRTTCPICRKAESSNGPAARAPDRDKRAAEPETRSPGACLSGSGCAVPECETRLTTSRVVDIRLFVSQQGKRQHSSESNGLSIQPLSAAGRSGIPVRLPGHNQDSSVHRFFEGPIMDARSDAADVKRI
ncbi:hypothetical protein HETIRDRAFT_426187 [Heterobasidion irregulare TC 32-1]|uniref:Uncharacterized protein n=1 Tax=Heterobasidion irregulare (strain TC 32-1) TaxID=747525 RepID=W4K9X5_HETIT|nr:uncharacterized protein HETIRDRAFT_426187 [Heterobasidion irregulare TC 32-1]ETW82554.1 hypothetical protein HETIRDRAFT_426187 [Heterobasidion irregulare TC 32-1]